MSMIDPTAAGMTSTSFDFGGSVGTAPGTSTTQPTGEPTTTESPATTDGGTEVGGCCGHRRSPAAVAVLSANALRISEKFAAREGHPISVPHGLARWLPAPVEEGDGAGEADGAADGTTDGGATDGAAGTTDDSAPVDTDATPVAGDSTGFATSSVDLGGEGVVSADFGAGLGDLGAVEIPAVEPVVIDPVSVESPEATEGEITADVRVLQLTGELTVDDAGAFLTFDVGTVLRLLGLGE